MGYSLDLSKISINQYKDFLKNRYLIPSRKILLSEIDAKFEIIKSNGLSKLSELKNVLSTSSNLIKFSNKTGLSSDYLTILRRELLGVDPKVVLIADFPETDEKTLDSLIRAEIKSSKDYFEFYHSLKDKNEITRQFNLPIEKAHELFCLCDLVRINGVGAMAAKSFFDANYKSVADIANSSANELLNNVSMVNNNKQYYKAKLGLNDMQYCIDFAKLINSIE